MRLNKNNNSSNSNNNIIINNNNNIISNNNIIITNNNNKLGGKLSLESNKYLSHSKIVHSLQGLSITQATIFFISRYDKYFWHPAFEPMTSCVDTLTIYLLTGFICFTNACDNLYIHSARHTSHHTPVIVIALFHFCWHLDLNPSLPTFDFLPRHYFT